MRKIEQGKTVKIWLSANDTYNWANRIGSSWPCSTLSDKRVFIELDDSGLVDLTINGRSDVDCDANELNAIIQDVLEKVV